MIGSSASAPAQPKQSERFERLTTPLRPMLRRRAMTLTRNEADADDLVQETYLRAFTFFDSFQSESCIQSWLFKIQRSIFINQIRRKQVQREKLYIDRSFSAEEIDPPSEGRLHELSPRERLTLEELDEDISGALDFLPDPSRELMLMAALEDASYDEMADRLLCPVGTIRSRLSRTKRVLRRRLVQPAIRYGFIRN